MVVIVYRAENRDVMCCTHRSSVGAQFSDEVRKL
jgi:hypothetical protein